MRRHESQVSMRVWLLTPLALEGMMREVIGNGRDLSAWYHCGDTKWIAGVVIRAAHPPLAEEGAAEGEMVGEHYQLNGHEFDVWPQAPCKLTTSPVPV